MCCWEGGNGRIVLRDYPMSLLRGIEPQLASTVSANKLIYHTSNLRECLRVNREALRLHSVYKKRIFNYKSCENIISYASHACCIWICNEIEGSYDQFIITMVPSYTGRNITHLLPLALLLVTIQTATNSRYFLCSLLLWWYTERNTACRNIGRVKKFDVLIWKSDWLYLRF